MPNYREKKLKEILSNARGQLIGNYGTVVFVYILVRVFSRIATRLITIPLPNDNPLEFVPIWNAKAFMLSFLLSWVCSILLGIFTYGLNVFFLNVARQNVPLNIADIFSGFKKDVDKILIISILSSLITVLSVIPEFYMVIRHVNIPLVPLMMIESGITLVAGLIYNLFLCFSYMVLADHPEYTIDEILSESVRLISGRRVKFVKIWVITFLLNFLGSLALLIGSLWTATYSNNIYANFYLDAIGEEPGNIKKAQKEAAEKDTLDRTFFTDNNSVN